MLISFCRTLFLLVCVILSVRLMGKRQIGQLQPSELVVTILLSQIAAIPMQDNDLPMLNTIVAILLLTGIEIILSVMGMKSPSVRTLLEGKPVLLINDGVIDRNQLKRLRFTLDDVTDALRQKSIFDISQVQYAIAETNGSLSVMLKPDYRAVTLGVSDIKTKDNGMPVTVVSDGKIVKSGIKQLGLSKEAIQLKLSKKRITLENVFFMSLDKSDRCVLIEKEDKRQ